METILYNDKKKITISRVLKNGYLVDGKPQPVDPPIFELEYKPTPMPAHDTEIEILTKGII